MKKLYIVDLLTNNYKTKIYNSDVIYINRGNVSLINSKVISINKISKKYLEKKEFLKELNLKINRKYDFFIKELEIFNNRNDKNINISKVLNYLKIQHFFNSGPKKYELHCISDNNFTLEVISQISKKNFSNKNKYNLKNNYIKKNILFNNIKFLFKTLVLYFIVKIFNQNNLKINLKNKKPWSLSIYPNFYKSNNENFFGNNFNKINFLFTDETHLNHSLKKICSIYFMNRNKILNLESFINFSDILCCFFKIFKYKKNYQKFLDDDFKIGKLNFTQYYRSSLNMSFINRLKLMIYDKAINRFVNYYKLNDFHIYLFEYNFGFYLIRKFKENNCKIFAYQHGIFNKDLMWLDLISINKNKNYYPDNILSFNAESLNAYKQKYKNNVKKYILVKKTPSPILKNLKTIKYYGKNNKKILFLSGTHDIKDIFYFCKNNSKNQKVIFYIKTHPKNKFFFKNEEKLIKIKNISKRSFHKVFVSSTSTLAYDLTNMKKKFYLFKPDYKSS